MPGPIGRRDSRGLIPPQDADAESWLRRASDAAAREDWKLAADTLARVIDQHGHKTVSLDEGKHFYSAGQCAQEQIASWPPDGLAAYRLLYDAEAQRLLDEARQTQKLDPLREIARKYTMTTPGASGLDLLAAWLLDRHESAEALDVLHQLEELKQASVPRWRILEKYTIAYIMSGDRPRAAEGLEQMKGLDAASCPKDWEKRRELVRKYFASAGKNAKESGEFAEAWKSAWPQLLGPPSASGRMAGIAPTLSTDTPWRDALPGAERLNRAVVERVMHRKARPPVWQVVSDGKALFVSTPAGVIARDLASFDFLWQAPAPSGQHSARVLSQQQQVFLRFGNGEADTPEPTEEKLDPLSNRGLFHEYAGSVSTAFGLVFAIDQLDTEGERVPSRSGEIPAARTMFGGETSANENTIRAYEADTGRILWTKGRGGPPEDELKEAHFFCAPVAAGSFLIAPYLQGTDISLAVFTPEGRVARKIVLGGVRPGMVPMNSVLQPTSADGSVYLNTGAGVVIALRSADFSLRWLAAYKRNNEERRQSGMRGGVFIEGMAEPIAQPDCWLNSPPLAAGTLLIVAPPDGESLLALDRRDGKAQWKVARDEYRYVVGADRERVILAGAKVGAVSLADGAPVWTYAEPRLVGRPILAGDRVLVPSETGLIVLNAANGTVIDKHDDEGLGLGNLLAVDGALYSVSMERIQKFPDIEQTRASAEARLAREPGDLDAVIRLAWLAALENKWDDTLKLLDDALEKLGAQWGGSAPASPATSDRYLRASHLRVMALLRLAEQAAVGQRGDFLDRAVATALTADDRIQSGLAQTKFLAEQGGRVEAFEHALELLRQYGDTSEQVESNLTASATVLFLVRMRDDWQAMSDDQRRAVAERLRGRIQADLSARDFTTLIRMSDGLPFSEEGARADIWLARALWAEGELESAVFFLHRAERRAGGTAVAAEALARLALIYAAPGADLPAAPSAASAALSRLNHDYAAQKLPEDVLNCGGSGLFGDESAKPFTGTTTDFVAKVRHRLPEGVSAASPSLPSILTGLERLRPLNTERDAIQGSRAYATMSFFDANSPRDLYDQVLPLRITRQVKGLKVDPARTSRVWWSSDLLEEVVEPSPTQFIEPSSDCVGSAAICGRVAALDAGGQIQAVGLFTGRTLWPPLFKETFRRSTCKPPLIASGGMIAIAADAEALVGVPAREGAQPRWRRRFGRLKLGRLASVADKLVVIDRNAANLFVLDPETGLIEKQFGLLVGEARPDLASTDDTEDPDAHVVVVGATVIRSGSKRLVARDVLTGRQKWDLPLTGRIQDLRPLGAGCVGATYDSDHLAVVEASSGKVVTDYEAKESLLPPVQAALEDAPDAAGTSVRRLFLFLRTDDNPAKYVLICKCLSDASKSWMEGPWEQADINLRMMTAHPAVIPVLNYVQKPMGRIRGRLGEDPGQAQLTGLVLLDKATGKRFGETRFEFDQREMFNDRGPRDSFKMVRDIILLDKVIVAVSADGYVMLTKDQPKQAAAKGEEAKP